MLNVITGALDIPTPPVTNSYESIATVTVGSGGAASIEFTSIASTYKHLQIRGIGRAANAATYAGLRLQVGNGSIDTGSNYNTHDLYGDGSSVVSSATAPNSNIYAGTISASSLGSNIFGVGVIDILDYADTNKNKTVRSMTSTDANGSGYAYFSSGAWRNTAAINTIKLFTTAGNFVQYSQFALYGIKG